MQEVLYFPPPPSSVASFIQSVSKLGEIKAEKNLFAELDIPVVQKKRPKAASNQGRKVMVSECGLPTDPKSGLEKKGGTPGKKPPLPFSITQSPGSQVTHLPASP